MAQFEDLRIVFFGTPTFAVASLDAVIKAGGNVVAVVTAPDKPAGRGKQLQQSAVKQFAIANNLPLLQPEKMKSADFLVALADLKADLQIVVAFRMMPVEVWDMPPLGTYNVHGSLLPQYRGAAPINRAIMNGETITGVTTFKLKHEIDTGDILLQHAVTIEPNDTAGTLHDKLMEAGAALLVSTIQGIAAGTLPERPQNTLTDAELKPAPKLFKEHMLIDWNANVADINNLIRGLSPYPAAFTHLDGKSMKVFACNIETTATNVTPGAFDTDHKTYFRFAAKNGWVYVTELQLEGKKAMDVAAFLRGFRS